MSARAAFDFGGVRAEVRGPSGVVEELARDFSRFRVGSGAGGICLELELARDLRAARALRLFPRTRRYRVRDEGSCRLVVYTDGSQLEWDFAAGRGRAWAREVWRLREIGYLTILSRVGEALEERGLARVHALGFARGAEAGLLVLPSGAGKSVIALEMARAPGWGLLSDDTPLVDEKACAHPFPLRFGFLPDADLRGVGLEWRREFRRWGRATKIAVDAEFFRGRLAGPSPVRWVVVGERRPGAATAAAPLPWAAGAVALIDALVVGRGVAQLSELMLRPGAGSTLARLAAGRWRRARALLSRARLIRLTIGGGPAEALAALEAALESDLRRQAASVESSDAPGRHS